MQNHLFRFPDNLLIYGVASCFFELIFFEHSKSVKLNLLSE